MKSIIFDIETVPDYEGIAKIYPDLLGQSNSQLIINFWKKRKPELSLEDAQKAFFPVQLQKVITIGVAIYDFDENSFNLLSLSANSFADEKLILKQFFGGIEKYSGKPGGAGTPPQLITWNGGGFDLPVLQHRSMIHSIICPIYWEVGETRSDFRFNHYLNRYQYRHLDLMDVLASYSIKNFSRLDDMARLCGFPGKKGMDGSEVAGEFEKGNLGGIAKYCEADVLNTFLLYVRFLLISGRIDNFHEKKIFDSLQLWFSQNKAGDDFWSEIIEKLPNT